MEKPAYASRVPAWVLRAHVILGTLQLSVGVLAIIFSIVATTSALGALLHASASGIWSAPFFIAAGISGLVAGKSERRCTLGCVVTCLVFSIMASVFSASALIEAAVINYANNVSFMRQSTSNRCRIQSSFRTAQAMSIICCVLFGAEFLLAIVHSAFACRASCCCVSAHSQQAPASQQHVAQYAAEIPIESLNNGRGGPSEFVIVPISDFDAGYQQQQQQQQQQQHQQFAAPTYVPVLAQASQQPPGYDEPQPAGFGAHEVKAALA